MVLLNQGKISPVHVITVRPRINKVKEQLPNHLNGKGIKHSMRIQQLIINAYEKHIIQTRVSIKESIKRLHCSPNNKKGLVHHCHGEPR